MKAERVLQDEVLAAIREQGSRSIESIIAVVLETDGSFSVITGEFNGQTASSLKNVEKAA